MLNKNYKINIVKKKDGYFRSDQELGDKPVKFMHEYCKELDEMRIKIAKKAKEQRESVVKDLSNMEQLLTNEIENSVIFKNKDYRVVNNLDINFQAKLLKHQFKLTGVLNTSTMNTHAKITNERITRKVENRSSFKFNKQTMIVWNTKVKQDKETVIPIYTNGFIKSITDHENNKIEKTLLGSFDLVNENKMILKRGNMLKLNSVAIEGNNFQPLMMRAITLYYHLQYKEEITQTKKVKTSFDVDLSQVRTIADMKSWIKLLNEIGNINLIPSLGAKNIRVALVLAQEKFEGKEIITDVLWPKIEQALVYNTEIDPDLLLDEVELTSAQVYYYIIDLISTFGVVKQFNAVMADYKNIVGIDGKGQYNAERLEVTIAAYQAKSVLLYSLLIKQEDMVVARIPPISQMLMLMFEDKHVTTLIEYLLKKYYYYNGIDSQILDQNTLQSFISYFIGEFGYSMSYLDLMFMKKKILRNYTKGSFVFNVKAAININEFFTIGVVDSWKTLAYLKEIPSNTLAGAMLSETKIEKKDGKLSGWVKINSKDVKLEESERSLVIVAMMLKDTVIRVSIKDKEQTFKKITDQMKIKCAVDQMFFKSEVNLYFKNSDSKFNANVDVNYHIYLSSKQDVIFKSMLIKDKVKLKWRLYISDFNDKAIPKWRGNRWRNENIQFDDLDNKIEKHEHKEFEEKEEFEENLMLKKQETKVQKLDAIMEEEKKFEKESTNISAKIEVNTMKRWLVNKLWKFIKKNNDKIEDIEDRMKLIPSNLILVVGDNMTKYIAKTLAGFALWADKNFKEYQKIEDIVMYTFVSVMVTEGKNKIMQNWSDFITKMIIEIEVKKEDILKLKMSNEEAYKSLIAGLHLIVLLVLKGMGPSKRIQGTRFKDKLTETRLLRYKEMLSKVAMIYLKEIKDVRFKKEDWKKFKKNSFREQREIQNIIAKDTEQLRISGNRIVNKYIKEVAESLNKAIQVNKEAIGKEDDQKEIDRKRKVNFLIRNIRNKIAAEYGKDTWLTQSKVGKFFNALTPDEKVVARNYKVYEVLNRAAKNSQRERKKHQDERKKIKKEKRKKIRFIKKDGKKKKEKDILENVLVDERMPENLTRMMQIISNWVEAKYVMDEKDFEKQFHYVKNLGIWVRKKDYTTKTSEDAKNVIIKYVVERWADREEREKKKKEKERRKKEREEKEMEEIFKTLKENKKDDEESEDIDFEEEEEKQSNKDKEEEEQSIISDGSLDSDKSTARFTSTVPENKK